MSEKLEDILETCRMLHTMVRDCIGPDEVKSLFGFAIDYSDTDANNPARVRVGQGVGPTIEAAARDWRARLVQEMKNDISRHEAYKKWLEDRGLLG